MGFGEEFDDIYIRTIGEKGIWLPKKLSIIYETAASCVILQHRASSGQGQGLTKQRIGDDNIDLTFFIDAPA